MQLLDAIQVGKTPTILLLLRDGWLRRSVLPRSGACQSRFFNRIQEPGPILRAPFTGRRISSSLPGSRPAPQSSDPCSVRRVECPKVLEKLEELSIRDRGRETF